MLKRTLASVLVLGAVVAVLYSCKDFGHAPSRPALTASKYLVVLNPGGRDTVTIRGGNPPYTISRQPNSLLATATLLNNANGTGTLVIQAATGSVSGSTSIKVKDTHRHDSQIDAPAHEEEEIEIEIRVSPVAVSFASQIQPIFTTSCVNAGCHPGGGAPFSLAVGESYENLVNQNATGGPCRGQSRVAPGDANNSVLVKRLEGSSCGNRMPLGGSALPAAQIQLIRDWISQGAPRN